MGARGRWGTRGLPAAALAAVVSLVIMAPAHGGTAAPKAGVRAATWISGFDASPDRVRKGRTITVSGVLKGRQGATFPLSNKRVDVYFKRSGSGSWSRLGSATTNDRGRFVSRVKARHDGSFKAVYPGSILYKKSSGGPDAVDVR
ncbi:hypothetical protein GCM10027168_63900 [Streptomyces capparidis]